MMEQRVLLDYKVRKASKVCQEQSVLWDRKVQLVQQDHKVQQGHRVPQEQQGHRVPKVRKAYQEHKEPEDQREPRDPKEQQVQRDRKDPKGSQVRQGARQEARVQRVLLDQRDPPDLLLHNTTVSYAVSTSLGLN
jgi:hypothetical protein